MEGPPQGSTKKEKRNHTRFALTVAIERVCHGGRAGRLNLSRPMNELSSFDSAGKRRPHDDGD